MANWIRVVRASECLPGTATEAVVGDRIVALYNVEGTFYALDGVCPHQGGPLGSGQLDGCIVTRCGTGPSKATPLASVARSDAPVCGTCWILWAWDLPVVEREETR